MKSPALRTAGNIAAQRQKSIRSAKGDSMTDISIPPKALEAAAEDIYNHWQFSFAGKVPWVPGGNSLMQEKARDLARAACLAMLRNWPGMVLHPGTYISPACVWLPVADGRTVWVTQESANAEG